MNDYILGKNRYINYKKNLQEMKARSIQIPMGSRFSIRKKLNKSHFGTPLY